MSERPGPAAAPEIDDAFLDARVGALEAALTELAEAPPFAKARYQTQVHRLAGELLDSDAGLRALLELAPRISTTGTFAGGPWEHASRLLPQLVAIGLRGEGVTPTLEALSELRMLAVLLGKHREDGLDPERAESFLEEVLVQNMDLLQPEATEDVRRRPKIYARAERLLALVRENVSAAGFGGTLVEEVETICAQRPIITRRVQKLLQLADGLPDDALTPEQRGRLDRYLRATGAVTAASERAGSPAAYAGAVGSMTADELGEEAEAFADSMHDTGLASPYHAVLVRHLAAEESELLPRALGLSRFGAACLDDKLELVRRVVETAIAPGTETGVLGLAKTLDRGLFSRPEIDIGIRRLLRAEILPSVARRLAPRADADTGTTPRALLIAGTVAMLGLPLGIGQGHNPTCQAARGLSLWSQHAPGLLLKILDRAVRNGILHLSFEQHELVVTEAQVDGAAARFDLDLDPVSAVLVPLLDLQYARLLALAQGRRADAHQWVNPAMYGSWVPGGFAGVFDPLSGVVTDHEGFVRRFYATHHPDHNGGYELLYPNPVGIIITDVHGTMLGYHAVSIVRIARDPDGETRVYFFNPNNEGRQRWGQGVAPTVSGNGERPGESSLPFAQFASRLYAYHFERYEKGDEAAVPAEIVAEATRMARESWGRSVTWSPLAPPLVPAPVPEPTS